MNDNICCKNMFTFNSEKILNSDDNTKLWSAYEEVCARIAYLQNTKQTVPEEMEKLKLYIRSKIKK